MEIAGLGGVFSGCRTRVSPISIWRRPHSRDPEFGFDCRTFIITAGAWKISLYLMTGAWASLGTTWKKRGLMPKYIRLLFLSSFTSIHPKNRETYFLTKPRMLDSVHRLKRRPIYCVLQSSPYGKRYAGILNSFFTISLICSYGDSTVSKKQINSISSPRDTRRTADVGSV
jgi:hypothetical protein